MSENQKVFLRLRTNECIQTNKIHFNNKDYYFDKILSVDQEKFYKLTAKQMVNDFIAGYNCTYMAYGQTGTGKTYTIQGSIKDEGVIQRSFKHIFENLKDFDLKVTFCEIYNESIYDLFSKEINEINLREDSERKMFLENIVYENPKSYEECLSILDRGIKQRKTAITKINIESSRSHSVLTLYLESIEHNIKRISKLNFVDLAGSEKVDHKFTNDRIKETCHINKSLLGLSQVIERLCNNEEFINYRDSKLTFVLRDSLGGNSKVAVVGNIRYKSGCDPNQTLEIINVRNKNIHFEKENKDNSVLLNKENDEYFVKRSKKDEDHYETINTLEFLSKLKMIKNEPKTNAEVVGDLKEITEEYKKLFFEHEILKKRIKKNERLYQKRTKLQKQLISLNEEVQNLKDIVFTVRKRSVGIFVDASDKLIIKWKEMGQKMKKIFDEQDKEIDRLFTEEEFNLKNK